MARKAKHDQHTTPPSFVCEKCKEGDCVLCVDVIRICVGLTDTLCNCKRKNHSGEARDNQIVDPETGTVYGPGLRVTQEGEVLDGGYSNSDGSDTGH